MTRLLNILSTIAFDYREEINVAIINLLYGIQTIRRGERIAKMVSEKNKITYTIMLVPR